MLLNDPFSQVVTPGDQFIGMAKILDQDKSMLKKLHVGEDQVIAAAVVCGYPDEKPVVKEKKMKAEFFK